MLTRERLMHVLRYEPLTGEFFWRRDAVNFHHRAGDRAGRDCRGYVKLKIDRKDYYAHRLAWFYTYGRWPVGVTDHINGIRSDNRISNLREASPSLNGRSRSQKAGRSGIVGVKIEDGRFRVAVSINDRLKHIGRYDTAEEARAAYVAAVRSLHPGEPIRGIDHGE